MTKETIYDVAIAGGGMVGLTLGLALAKAGLEVAIADAQAPQTTLAPHFDGRAYAIAFSSYRMWRALGLAEALDPHAQPIERIMVTDGRPGAGVRRGGVSPLHLQFDQLELGENGEALGYMLENRFIRLALEEAVGACETITRIAPAKVLGVSAGPGEADLTLADGQTLRARLIIGADGKDSFIRQALGIRTMGWAYPSTAIVATVAHERPHHGVAHELFLPHGPFAILPLVGDRSNIVWMEPHAAAQTLMAMGEAAFLAELRRRFGDFLGAITLEGPRFVYPLQLQIAERLIGPRTALAGDSAHRVHPIAGQGLNIGLKDVAALAECVVDAARLGLDFGGPAVLERYQRWRRFDIMSMAAATDFFDRLFSNDLGPVRLARGLGLAMVNAMPPARRFFMRYAGGAAGAPPRLLRGEALG